MSISLEPGASATMPGHPEQSVGMVMLTNEGDESVGAYLMARRDTVIPPRRAIAQALLALALQLEADADEAGEA